MPIGFIISLAETNRQSKSKKIKRKKTFALSILIGCSHYRDLFFSTFVWQTYKKTNKQTKETERHCLGHCFAHMKWSHLWCYFFHFHLCFWNVDICFTYAMPIILSIDIITTNTACYFFEEQIKDPSKPTISLLSRLTSIFTLQQHPYVVIISSLSLGNN